MSSKSEIFLSKQAEIVKLMYRKHVSDGGDFPLKRFQEEIPPLMDRWIKEQKYDDYEDLTVDPVSEMESIANNFIRKYWPMYSYGDDYKTIKKLEMPEDYLNYDIERPAPINIQNSQLRDNNAIHIRNQPRPRMHDMNGEFKGRSLTQTNYSVGDTQDELLDYVNRPYATLDTYDIQYYGQYRDETNTILV